MNPNSKTCPIFRGRKDAELTKKIYRRIPVLWNFLTNKNYWEIEYHTMFNMTTDSNLFRDKQHLENGGYTLMGNVFVKEGDSYLPLYEGKMFQTF